MTKEEIEDLLDKYDSSIHSCIWRQHCRGAMRNQICWCDDLKRLMDENVAHHSDPSIQWGPEYGEWGHRIGHKIKV